MARTVNAVTHVVAQIRSLDKAATTREGTCQFNRLEDLLVARRTATMKEIRVPADDTRNVHRVGGAWDCV